MRGQYAVAICTYLGKLVLKPLIRQPVWAATFPPRGKVLVHRFYVR